MVFLQRSRRSRHQQVRALGTATSVEPQSFPHTLLILTHPWCFRESEDGREGMVLLQRERSQVPHRAADKQSDGFRLLEGDRERQGNPEREKPRGNEENSRVLHRKSSQSREDQLGHARIPPRRQTLLLHLPQRSLRGSELVILFPLFKEQAPLR